MKVALLTREYPPEVYGGAGVHVEYLGRELDAARRPRGALLGRRRGRTPASSRTAPWDALGGSAPHLAALQAMSIDLAMAAGVEGAEVVHSHTWYANFAGHLAKLTYDIPHVATVHSLEPLRPWKAEQLGGGYALSSFCERVSLEGADAVIAVSEGMRRDILAAYPAIPDERVQVIYNGIDANQYHARPGDRRAGALRRRPRPAVGRVRGADHAPEGRAVPARRRALVRGGRAARALRGRAGHARDRRRGRAARVDAAAGGSGANVIWLDQMLPKPDVIQLLSPRDRVRVPVDLRAARDREPRGDGVRGGGRGDGDGRDRRGRRRRRDGAARAVRAGAGRRSSRRDPAAFSAAIAERVNALLADPERAAEMGRAGRARAVEAFDWSAIARETVDAYSSVL